MRREKAVRTDFQVSRGSPVVPILRAMVFAFVVVQIGCTQEAPDPVAPSQEFLVEVCAEPTATPAAELDRKQLAARIKRHFESNGMIPPDLDVRIIDVSDSEVEGLDRGVLLLSDGDQEQSIEFLVSNDGKWFLRADAVDLTIDPIARVVDVIRIGPEDPFLGEKDAAVTIVEYSDFQCPYCARAEEIVKEQVLKEYGDRVKFVYKQLPLVEIHPWSEKASAIGLCLLRHGGNGAYWDYHAAVFARQREIELEDAEDQLFKLVDATQKADLPQIKKCYESGEPAEILLATQQEANELGVNSTPTFFINGRRLSGAQPLEAFQEIIEPLLGSG